MAYPTFSVVAMTMCLMIALEYACASFQEECVGSSISDSHTCQTAASQASLAESLLQTKFHREAAQIIVQQIGCDSITSAGKCWYLSEVGQSCERTCALHGLKYSFVAPKHDMVPLLLGHSPAGRLDPWLHVECYVPGEDRYHTYNPQAWGVPGMTPTQDLWQAGQYSYESCQLSCPCDSQTDQPVVPTPAPTRPIVTGYSSGTCTGVEEYGRCWYLSSRGASCDDTCLAHDCSYSFAAPGEDMVPKLIGHTPSGRLEPWTYLECYISKEDVYHPANTNARVGSASIAAELAVAGQYNHESCRMSCPCEGQCRGAASTPAPVIYATPAPSVPRGVPMKCRGMIADGACWYLSETGDNCDNTCAAQGSSYRFTAPSQDMVPKLVGHTPSVKNQPWLFLECYVPKEDRYHPFNKNAWGVPAKTPVDELPEAGEHNYPTCQLSCPCDLYPTTQPPTPAPTLPPTLPPRTWPPTPAPTPAPTRPPTPAPRRAPTPVATWPPAPAPTQPLRPVNGVRAVGRTWFMSDRGESCAATCKKQGLTYSWAEPVKGRPIIPRILGREPGSKEWPWLFVECYVPDEDAYHTVNPSAWGVPGVTLEADLSQAAYWSSDVCQLACPCSENKEECGWVQPPACAPEFEYKGQTYTGCIMADHDEPWCMHHHHHTGKDSYLYEWSRCINTCDETVVEKERGCGWRPASSCVREFDYEGTHYVGCTNVDHDTPWCSSTHPYSGAWAHCQYGCENPTPEDQKLIDQFKLDTEKDELLCSWRPVQECAPKFTYKGYDYEGCAMYVDHPTPWCSHHRMHIGNWSQCERFCTKVVQ